MELKKTMKTLKNNWVRTVVQAEAGMATAEYAIGTLAAAAFAGLLLAIMRGGQLKAAIQSLIESALAVS